MRRGDEAFVELERAIEEHVSRTGLDAPPSPGESALAPVAGLADSIHDLGTAGIGSVIWATGYSLDFAWIELPSSTTAENRSNAAASPPHRVSISSA